MDFVTCFAFAQPINLREQIHNQVSVMQIVPWIVFKDYNKLLVFWIKYFKNGISVYYVLLIIYNLFAL